MWISGNDLLCSLQVTNHCREDNHWHSFSLWIQTFYDSFSPGSISSSESSQATLPSDDKWFQNSLTSALIKCEKTESSMKRHLRGFFLNPVLPPQLAAAPLKTACDRTVFYSFCPVSHRSVIKTAPHVPKRNDAPWEAGEEKGESRAFE